MPHTAYLDFMRNPDPAAREQELATFIGPNAAPYLKSFETMRQQANRQPGEKLKFSLGANGFNVLAFFLGPVWFFYRRMWAWGWGYSIFLLLLGAVIDAHPEAGRLSFGLSVGMAIATRQLYLAAAISRIQKMRATSPGGLAYSGESAAGTFAPTALGSVSPEALRAAGGVSVKAGWISGVICVLFAIYGIITTIAELKAGTMTP